MYKVNNELVSERVPVHNNTDMNMETFVHSDGVYDYCIVNGESLTRYYGSTPGEYESIPLHILVDIRELLEANDWMMDLLCNDAYTTKLYKHHENLRCKIIRQDSLLRELQRYHAKTI